MDRPSARSSRRDLRLRRNYRIESSASAGNPRQPVGPWKLRNDLRSGVDGTRISGRRKVTGRQVGHGRLCGRHQDGAPGGFLWQALFVVHGNGSLHGMHALVREEVDRKSIVWKPTVVKANPSDGTAFNGEPAIYIKGVDGLRHCAVVAGTWSGFDLLTNS